MTKKPTQTDGVQTVETIEPPIALNMIVKDSEPAEMLERCFNSVKGHVDGFYITITYKTKKPDDTNPLVELVKKWGGVVTFFKWNNSFADARNFAADQVPKDYYWLLWLDTDDVLHGSDKLRQIAREGVIYNQSAIFFLYWYAVELDDEGNVKEVVIEHKRERLVRNNKSFKWIGKLHETLIEQAQANIVKVFRKECIVVHLSPYERAIKNTNRNIEILENAAREEDHRDPRTLVYLAKAYFDRGRGNDVKKREIDFQLAEALFREYLFGSGTPGSKDYRPPSGWAGERATAWEYLSDIYALRGLHGQGVNYIFNAIAEDPSFPQYYVKASLLYCMLGDWDKAEQWLKIASGIKMPETTMVVNPRDLKTSFLEAQYHIAIHKQKLEAAKEAAELLAKMLPDHPEAADRAVRVNNVLHLNKVAQSFVYVAKHLEATQQQKRIVELIKAVPSEIESEPFVSQMRHRFLPPRVWNDDEIAIVCGPGFEKWSPKKMKTGLGGSEEAVIQMAKRLYSRGFKVIVYGDPRDDSGVYDGVEYRSFADFNQKDSFNILVYWRAVGFVDTDAKAKQTYLWLHDVPNNPDFTEERVSKLDKIFVLSEYHKSLLRMYKDGEFVEMPEDKVLVSANGLDKININKKWKRQPHSIIWTSSYDRGLIYLLNMWPHIRKEVPDATLHIYYGWDLFDYAHRDNPERMKWKGAMNELMLQEGIIHHGRVGHSEIIKATAQADVWAYPTDFQEISCISAMKAQAAGAFPVVTDYAALKETVKYGIKVAVDITDQEGQEEYKQQLISTLNGSALISREEMMEWAQTTFSWDLVADSWVELFKKLKTNVVELD